ncbi:hypothetical protein DPMN_074437 [Dreissena polymorpha]|uniref:Uncharacterized protein n=1 Tax=Dreissena polymorpha TaxID=45954 RepID=A0A9D4BLP1_DREPO|nr:hypothetical protein DPMN_074437 [Dreissena polymorpha]
MADTGARPKEKSSKKPSSLKEDSVSLKNVEAMLKAQLASLTLKKIPISRERDQLLQERAQLQKIVERRDSVETCRLRREIEELKQQLADFDLSDDTRSPPVSDFGLKGSCLDS